MQNGMGLSYLKKKKTKEGDMVYEVPIRQRKLYLVNINRDLICFMLYLRVILTLQSYG